MVRACPEILGVIYNLVRVYITFQNNFGAMFRTSPVHDFKRLCLIICFFFFFFVQGEFWVDPRRSILKAYEKTDQAILSNSSDLGRGGSTAVTAILINGRRLWIANVGDSRALLSQGGRTMQMSTDHEPRAERSSIEDRGGFVSNLPGK